MNEREAHIAISQGLKRVLPESAFLFHVPNGGSRHKIEAARMKPMGVVAGVPDLMLIYGGRVFGIEVKSPKRKPKRAELETMLSKKQREAQASLDRAGCLCVTVTSLIEVTDFLMKCGVPLQGRVAA